jgi:hypothetical protein
MVRDAGFDTVEMGATGHRALAFVRGRKPRSLRPAPSDRFESRIQSPD